MSRRRRSLVVLALTLLVAAFLTRETFRATAGSTRQTALTYLLAATLLGGVALSGDWPKPARGNRRPFVGPALVGALLFAAFVVLGWLSSWIGPVDRGVAALTAHARAGAVWEIVLGATVAGAAEEVFYRGALFERVRLPVLTTTFAHMATTLLAANIALTLAAGVLGIVLGLTRRTSGGWWSPTVTHVVWALLIVAWLPT